MVFQVFHSVALLFKSQIMFKSQTMAVFSARVAARIGADKMGKDTDGAFPHPTSVPPGNDARRLTRHYNIPACFVQAPALLIFILFTGAD